MWRSLNDTAVGKLLLASVLAVAPLAMAQAAIISGTWTVDVFQGTGGGLSTDPTQQALPTNPLNTPADEIASFTYTGNLNLINNAPGSGNILTFMNSAGGVLSAFTVGSAAALNVAMSNPGFGLATLMDFTASSGGLTGTITHDDGISLFQGGVNQIPLSASAPTVSVPTNFTALPGTYHLWYVEVNGDPAQLTMNAVPAPEPASLALMGTALIGLTLIAKRRKSN